MSGVRPPTAQDLVALPNPAWATVLAHVRRALAELGPTAVTPAIARLRALPAKKLMQGRGRRELSDLLALGGVLWSDAHARLERADVGPDLAWLVQGLAAPPAADSAPRRSGPPASEDVAALRQDLEEARARSRRAIEERDEARRQVAGATSRLDQAGKDAATAAATIAALEAQVAELVGQIEQAGRDRDRAVSREQRRQQAVVEGLQAEVTALRRADEERRAKRRERQRAQTAAESSRQAEAQAAQERERERRAGGAGRAAPGRPSELPPGAVEGTTEHARALLTSGRRVLVDGYNVAKTVRGDLPDEEAQRAWLEQALLDLAARRGIQPEVYWDGDSRSGSSSRQGALLRNFSSQGVEADDDIEFAVVASEEDEPLVVVTDDRGLRARVMPYKVDLLGSQSFAWALRG